MTQETSDCIALSKHVSPVSWFVWGNQDWLHWSVSYFVSLKAQWHPVVPGALCFAVSLSYQSAREEKL